MQESSQPPPPESPPPTGRHHKLENDSEFGNVTRGRTRSAAGNEDVITAFVAERISVEATEESLELKPRDIEVREFESHHPLLNLYKQEILSSRR
jgi:hypothetical protein